MTIRTTFSIAIPAVALLLIVLVLGQPRWLGKPWLVIGPPMRALLAVLFGLLLIVAIARALI
jgi:hypothetical protein